MSVEIVRDLPEGEWRRFVDEHPDGNIFHTPEMYQVFNHTKGFRPELWAATKDGKILSLLLPVQITLFKGLLRDISTRSVVFGSVICAPGSEGREALRVLLGYYKRNVNSTLLFTELRNVSPLGDLLPIMVDEGFAYKEYLNYLINLDRPTEAIFHSIGKRTRKNINNGLNKAQVTIEEVSNKNDLGTCYGLLDKTYRAAHVPLAEYSLFQTAFDILFPKKMIRFIVAKVNGNPAATSIELLYKDVLYGWYGGMDRSYSSYVPNEMLMWHILNWGAENGFKTYDFGGAGKPDEEYGVRDFKAKFGGDLVSFGRNFWARRPFLFFLSKIGYEIYRQLK
jgi:serine/alanine adding enzyme